LIAALKELALPAALEEPALIAALKEHSGRPGTTRGMHLSNGV